MRDKRVNRNWYYDPDTSEPVPEDLIERIKANLKAITLLRELESGVRLPSADEANALARYSGWSPMREFFQPKFLSSNPDRWEATYGSCFYELGQLASEQEISSLYNNWRSSQRINPQACKALWRIAEHLGFHGGRVFEPGLGIGIIQGACPESLRERVAFTGVELEPIAARIAQKLFPDARVVNARLEDVLLENQCDLVIGFVPMGKRVKDAIIDVELDLHNYCFARGLHALRPGGIMVAVTSRRTMDFGMTQRRYLASISEFIGAIRVPREFITLDDQAEALDIVMLRRPDGRKIFESPNWLLSREKKDIIAHDGLIAQDGPNDQSRRNEYFDDHQGMILGSEFLSGAFRSYAVSGRLGDYQYAVKSDPEALKRELDKAVNSLPTGLCTSRSRRRVAPGQQNIQGAQTEDVPIGTYSLGSAGQVLYREPSGLTVPQWAETERLADTRLGLQSRLALARSYIGLRDRYLALLKDQQDPSLSAELVETRRQELSDLYDQHVVRWGELNRKGSPALFLSDDLYFFSVLGLEEIRIEERDGEEAIEISKGAVFSRRTVSAAPEITVSETVDDALIQSIGFKGLIDLPYMETLLGRQSESIVNELIQKDLVFINPANNRLETREDYLSGNVREKYNQAKKLVQNGAERFTRNLAALEAVLPKDVPIEEIDAKFGAKWIEPSCIEEYLRRVLKLETQVSYNSRVDLWKIEIKRGKKSVENTSTYGTTDDPAHEIILKLLNQRSLNVYKSVEMPWGLSRIFDAVATADLETKAVQLQQLFIQFTRSTPAVSESISAAFNQRLNAHVPTTYHDGRHLRLPGFSDVFRRDDHQLRAVWRGLIEGCGAIAYETGLGKTLIQVMLARESKRLKRVNKPAIVAFNSTVSQFAETFRAAYPDAKILVADSQNFNSRNRQKFLTRAMHGDWDAVILSHSDFTSIPCSKRTVERYYDHVIEELQECIDDAEGADRSEEIRTYYWHIRQTRERKDKALERLADDHNGEIYWEQLGIDMLLVDEVHEFKKMPFLTKMANVRGVDTSYSLRGMDLDMKRLDVQERNGNGRGVYGATGTPIDNTMAEIWNLVRLTAPHRLKEFSVETFDQFAASFCEQVTRIELNEANNRWVRRTRLAKFKHGHSFVRFVASAVDVYMPNAFSRQEINGKPKLATGRPIPVVIPLSEANRQVNELMKKIWGEYEKATRKARYSHIPLLLLQVGQAAALDPRLVAPHLPENSPSKIRHIARNVARIYSQSHEQRGVQLVLMDRYRPLNVAKLEKLAKVKFSEIRWQADQVDDPLIPVARRSRSLEEPDDDGRFNAHRAARRACIEEGVDPEEVVVLNDAVKNIKSPEGKALLDKLNTGLIRVLIATRDKIGTGVNIQTRLIALHEADPPRTLSPKGMRQGHGRIDRPGNLNKEIYIYQYGMERTADAGIYHRLEMKARFIDQVLSGFVPGSNFDDPASATVQSLAELKAAITGDHRVLDLVRLQDDIRNLNLQRMAFYRQLGETRRRLSESKTHAQSISGSTIPRYERLCEVAGGDLVPRLIEKVSQGTTHVPVVWGDRKVNATGKNLRELLNFIFTRGARPGLSTTVQIDDLLLKLCFDAFLDRQYYSYSFLDPANPGRVLYTAEVREGGEGVLKSLESLPQRSVELLKASKAELATIDDDIRKLEANMRDEWPNEIEMISKKRQVEQLEAALEADEAGQAVNKEDDWLTEIEAEQQNESIEEREPEFPELNSESLGLQRESQRSLSLNVGFRVRL